MKNLYDFGEALKHVKQGKLACRKSWPSQVIFMRPSDKLSIEFVTDKVKSIPQSAKDFIDFSHNGETQYADGSPIMIHFSSYLCYVDENQNIINGWIPSQSDVIAEDWELL